MSNPGNCWWNSSARRLRLTGTHIGCDTSYCGACTVLLDGAAIKSCTLFAVQADGAEITTVEALEKDGQLHPLQQAFSEQHGLQCGYCTPGMLMSSVALLAENPEPDVQDIRKACREIFAAAPATRTSSNPYRQQPRYCGGHKSMEMKFSGEFKVDLPKQEVFSLLSDPEQFAPLLPGFHSMEMKDAKTAVIRARVGIGKIGGIATTELSLNKSEPPRHALYVGRGKLMQGVYTVHTSFDLTDTGAGTLIGWQGETQLTGKIPVPGRRWYPRLRGKRDQ